MKTVYILIIIGVTGFGRLSGQTPGNPAEAARQAVVAGNYSSAYEQANLWMFREPLSAEAVFYGAYAQLMLGNRQYALQTFQWCALAEPDWWSAPATAGYVYALEGREEEAKQNFLKAFRLLGTTTRDEVLKEFSDVARANGKTGLEQAYASWWRNPGEVVPIPTITEFYRQIAGRENNPAAVKAAGKSFADRYTALGRHDLVVNLYAELALIMGNYGKLTDALDMVNQGYLYLSRNGDLDNPYCSGRLLSRMLEILKTTENHEEALNHGEEIFRLSSRMAMHTWDIRSMLMLSGAAFGAGNPDECMKWAINAYNLAGKVAPSVHLYEAALAMSVAYSIQPAANAAEKSVEFARAAAQFAVQNKMEQQVPEVLAILGLRMFALRTRESMEQGITFMAKAAVIYEQSGRLQQAADVYNNLGVIQYDLENYPDAVAYLQKASAASLKYLDFISADAEERLTIYQQATNIQFWLAASYARMGKAAETFDAMEKSRAVVLRERTGSTGKPVSLEEFRGQLAKDEAAVFYLKFSGHEVVILTATRDHGAVVFHSDDSFIGDIKDKYLDRIKKENDSRRGMDTPQEADRDRRVTHQDFSKVLQLTRRYIEQPGTSDALLDEFLQGYYKFLILPVANRLVGYKRLIISADMEYNLIPFEALRTGDGRYLVEKFDIRYTPSASLLQDLRSREYSATRNPLLGMGGARFSAMEATAEPMNTAEDLSRLRIMVRENSRRRISQRRAFATLFGTAPMPYLPGTVEEIHSISRTVADSKIYLGEEMSEARIKAMSRSDELGRYKVLHLATHGFVVDELPELSGIAMTIGPKEDSGEDGFLTVSEVAALKLKTDLTVLSACQTALGKIYAGEGVTGLTQALLIAGSKAALVSLWPVNDNSTMLFMTRMYQEAMKGRPYASVASDIKRRFIRGEFGEQYKHPNFWAPFIYIGN